ncbi:MAG TPA: T9SS type A sorting domain-containing protein [Chitinophagaceae bacterium]|nr:T9SS type A sorting domain-containing protein [Chitinophagaceae bacterium]
MKKNLPYLCLFCSFIFSTHFASSQKDQFAYAITDVTKDGANWNFLRKLDLNTGSFSEIILNGTDAKQLAYDHATKKQLAEPINDARFGKMANAAFATGVAAIAYDKKNQRIYYTPMFINQLRYVDMKTMKVYFVPTPDIANLGIKAPDQSNIITRMAIADDGNGYALTNDGNHLLSFTTGKNITITDLGGLTDNPENRNVSVHNSCSSFGGDMIADDEGNLFLFSNRTNVFKINIKTRTATHLGAVSGLPPTFTINGAAVDHNNQILITSAVDNTNIFSVDSKTWIATPVKLDGGWRTADLANSNLLATRKSAPYVRLLPNLNEPDDDRVQLFPNPVTDNQFSIQFNLAEGNYTIQVKDVSGRQVTQSVTNIKGRGQIKTLNLPAGASKGFYLVKVIDQNNKTVYNKKILVH